VHAQEVERSGYHIGAAKTARSREYIRRDCDEAVAGFVAPRLALPTGAKKTVSALAKECGLMCIDGRVGTKGDFANEQ
jgi:hypothetical protein